MDSTLEILSRVKNDDLDACVADIVTAINLRYTIDVSRVCVRY